MDYNEDYDEYEQKDTFKTRFKESECGEIEIKAKNVYITINCKEKKEKKETEC